MSSMMPYTMVKPSASREYIAPRLSPLMTCCRRMSRNVMGASHLPPPAPPGDRAISLLGGDPDVVVLVQRIVGRVLLVEADLEDADDLVLQVPVLVKGDLALDRLEVGGLDGVADGMPVDGLPARHDPLDGVEDHERRIVGREGVVVGLLPPAL